MLKYLLRISLRICYVWMNFNENFTKDFKRVLLTILLGISQMILLRILPRKDFTKDFSRFHRPKWLRCRVLRAWKSITKPWTFIWIFGCAMMCSQYECQKKRWALFFALQCIIIRLFDLNMIFNWKDSSVCF